MHDVFLHKNSFMWLVLLIQATLLNMDRVAVKCQLVFVSVVHVSKKKQKTYSMNSENDKYFTE